MCGEGSRTGLGFPGVPESLVPGVGSVWGPAAAVGGSCEGCVEGLGCWGMGASQQGLSVLISEGSDC